jgi:PTHB1 N-terminus
VSGNFGNGTKTIICVQSVDGALFFYEAETMIFQIQLPDFLLPGPMIYASSIDSLVITNSNLEIECYRYPSLQAATNNNLAQQKAAQ